VQVSIVDKKWQLGYTAPIKTRTADIKTRTADKRTALCPCPAQAKRVHGERDHA